MNPKSPHGYGVKRLALTMGDPAGVGPEIIALAMEREELASRCLVVGDLGRLVEGARAAGSPVRFRKVSSPEEAGSGEEIPVLDLPCVRADLPFGRVSREGGEAAYRFLAAATDLALAGEVSAVVTAPLNKEALHLAGHHYPGHTEILAERSGAPDYVMMLAAGGMRVLHVTSHIPYAAVPSTLSPQRIGRVIHLGAEALALMGIPRPRLGVAGLNPHAGEGGIFGEEEIRVIAPAVAEARARGYQVEGPVSPDVVFLRMSRGHYDAVVAMYHDQGHIPVKLLSFESGVNVTLGLPIVRTSVDHGTAYDIAGKGRADPGSLIEAIRLASLMAENREKMVPPPPHRS